MGMKSEEVYLYHNLIKYLGKSCKPFSYGSDDWAMALELLYGAIATWAIVFLCICKGAKSISCVVQFLVPIPFVLIFVIMGYYLSLNNGVDGKGIDFYWGQE